MNEMDDERLSALVRTHASRHAAGSRLRSEVRARIALEAARTSSQPPRRLALAAAWTAWRARLSGLQWGTAMAGAMVGLLAGVLVLPRLASLPLPGRDRASAGETELVADHVQALSAGPLWQVASSDRHTVKPWFQGRIDYSPPVLDLSEQGFPLAGGRVDRLQGEATAVLVFEHRRHVVDLFVWPGERTEPESRAQLRGFNVVRWSDGAMQYRAVSDMDATELAQFSQAWRTRRAQP